MSGRGRSGSCCVSIISTSARAAPNVYPDLGDCGEGGQDEMLLVCVVLSCLCLFCGGRTEHSYSLTRKRRSG